MSLFYNLLSSISTNGKNPSMLKWEKDLSQTCSWEQWEKAITTITKTSACIEHWDNSKKSLIGGI